LNNISNENSIKLIGVFEKMNNSKNKLLKIPNNDKTFLNDNQEESDNDDEDIKPIRKSSNDLPSTGASKSKSGLLSILPPPKMSNTTFVFKQPKPPNDDRTANLNKTDQDTNSSSKTQPKTSTTFIMPRVLAQKPAQHSSEPPKKQTYEENKNMTRYI
jgi:hypothetical protein